MTRIVVIFSFFFAAACDVGSIQQAGTGVDGGGSGSGSGSNCENISANIPDGHHTDQTTVTQATAKQGCMAGAGCHNLAKGLGTGAPEFSYAGTLFKDAGGAEAYAGATVFVKLGATEKKTITANNGNFWFTNDIAGLAAPTVAMPATTKASACPNTQAMAGMLVQAGGDCNSCHKTGGTTTPMYVTP